MTEDQRAQRLSELARQARAAEAGGDGWAVGEVWREYALVRDGGRDGDELIAEGIAFSRLAVDLVRQSGRSRA